MVYFHPSLTAWLDNNICILQDQPSIQPDLASDNSQAANVSQNVEIEEFPTQNINRRIALASTVSAVGLFLSSRLDIGISLKDLSAVAVPYEQVSALSGICISICFPLFLLQVFPILLFLLNCLIASIPYAPKYIFFVCD